MVHLVLDQRGVQILLDALVEIRVHRFCFFFCASGNHCNLVRDDLSAGKGLRQRFGLALVGLAGDFSAKGHDALVTILIHCDVLEACLIECFPDVVRNSGCLRRKPGAATHRSNCKQGQGENEQLSVFHIRPLHGTKLKSGRKQVSWPEMPTTQTHTFASGGAVQNCSPCEGWSLSGSWRKSLFIRSCFTGATSSDSSKGQF